MPAPQFHLTFGELIARHPDIHPAMRAAVDAEPVYTHLGSIFHDLSYYGNMLLEAVRYGLRFPAIDAPWGFRMHYMRPDRFVAAFVRSAAITPGFTAHERLALVGGLLSHCALDLTLHPLVNYCARRDTLRYGGHETFHHRITEKYHALFFHVERFGDDIIGKPEFQLKTRIVKQHVPGRPSAEPHLVAFMREAYRHAYGNAPRGDEWKRWVQNFRHFGIATSLRVADSNSRRDRKSAELYRRYFKCADFDFWAFYAHSERRLAELVNLAHDYLVAGDFSLTAEDSFCAAARIDNLAEPDASYLPELPELPDVANPRALRLLPRPRIPFLARRPPLSPGVPVTSLHRIDAA